MKTQDQEIAPREQSAMSDGPQVPDRSSSYQRNTPHLTANGLSILLLVMSLIPVITIFALWRYMPPVHEGQLQAAVDAVDLPDDEFYEVHFAKRSEWPMGELIVKNESDQDWTHLNIQVNRHYQIYDIEPIPANEERRYKLNRFVSRTGARFELRYNPLKSVRIYARRPTKDRATFYHEFPYVEQ